MKQLPHTYTVNVNAKPDTLPSTLGGALPIIDIAPPKEFDGPGDQWSPEELLMASLSSCFILSFKAIARASKLQWEDLQCESSGVLEKVERKVVFSQVFTKATLLISDKNDFEKADKLLRKAEETCFISNSLSSELHFECDIRLEA